MSFSALGLLPELLKAVTEQGYQTPSPIQAKAIPAILTGRDIMAAAQTGTGKTAGFTLPILHQLASKKSRSSANQVKVLVLTPTRELAAQVADNVSRYSQHLTIRSDVVFGGVKINPQMMRLRAGVEVLTATPGRLLDLYQQNAVKFDELEAVVLDEADRMLDMGFIRDIKKILALLPKQRQSLLFSATFSPEIRELAKTLVKQPIEISVAQENTTAATIEHWLVAVDKKKKPALLDKLITEHKWSQVLVFTRTKHGANRLTRYLDGQGHKALAIHGNKSQGARTKALAQFKDKTIQVLVATDIAARGIDISQLPVVVNFELPNVQEDYVHRIGRTGRAGVDGEAISLVAADEYKQLVDIEHVIQQHIPRKEIEGFTAANPLDASRPIRPLKKKKPKKPKKTNVVKNEAQAGQTDQAKQAVQAKKVEQTGKARPHEQKQDSKARKKPRRHPNHAKAGNAVQAGQSSSTQSSSTQSNSAQSNNKQSKNNRSENAKAGKSHRNQGSSKQGRGRQGNKQGSKPSTRTNTGKPNGNNPKPRRAKKDSAN
ncbi:ATP-dependent helicase [Thalassotalea euphylliae]|uniref:DEAD-box ATP-dependent RNA helicase RhpA n=1 Tax=Thalassotalea euphylliae TaxID=1655234 RepID=A0A3E0TU08_9GAMM|nr:DEAD/DEAH box helicase [Thalassotalea euphylliae]REL27914.1 ATP-dependent helicase [Thalassotalea euphylliae]